MRGARGLVDVPELSVVGVLRCRCIAFSVIDISLRDVAWAIAIVPLGVCAVMRTENAVSGL